MGSMVTQLLSTQLPDRDNYAYLLHTRHIRRLACHANSVLARDHVE
jgi:hypothetical protein